MIDTVRLEAIIGEAGRIALGQWPGAGHAVKSWDKAPGNPVCAADIEVDGFLKRELGALLPAAGWLSEETVDDPARLGRSLVWVVDPIDGTRDFLRGRPGWAVSVALVSEGRPVIGMLAAPAIGLERMQRGLELDLDQDRQQDAEQVGEQHPGQGARRGALAGGDFWSAVSGKGAYRNGKRIAAIPRDSLVGARVPADSLSREDRDLIMVSKPNSIALRTAMVAAGEADLVATLRWGSEWDVAAASLIASEAGARVSDAFGKTLTYNKRIPRAFGLLVCSPALQAAAVARLSERAARIGGRPA